MKKLNFNSRENARTPMQWDSTKNGGFTEGKPWKKVNDKSDGVKKPFCGVRTLTWPRKCPPRRKTR